MSTIEEKRREAELNRKLDLLTMSFHATLVFYKVKRGSVTLQLEVPTLFNGEAHRISYFPEQWLALSISFRRNEQAELETHPLGFVQHGSFHNNFRSEIISTFTSDKDHFQLLSKDLQDTLEDKDLIITLIPETIITPLEGAA